MRTLGDKILKDSRQMPTNRMLVREKNYCDLLYAWLQCNSERVHPTSRERCIAKSKVKWAAIERDFTRELSDGTIEKIMDRRTVAKYFNFLLAQGLIKLEEDTYYLTLLEGSEAHLIEYNTLSKLMNVLQKNSLSIYIYLYNRYYANNSKPFIATMKQIKEYIGVATTTTSNNVFIDDTLDILKRLNLLDYELTLQEGKSYLTFKWVKNQLV